MKKATLITLLSVCFSTLFAQKIVWEKTFNKSKFDEFTCVRVTTDGGCILGGSFYNTNLQRTTNSFNIWLTKRSDTGKVEWEKQFEDTVETNLSDFALTQDKGYILLASTCENKPLRVGVRLIRLSATNRIIWDRKYPSLAGNNILCSVLQTKSGGYIVLGLETTNQKRENNTITSNQMAFLCLFDQSGELIWKKTYQFENFVSLLKLIQAQDGGYIVYGEKEVLSIDSNGVLQRFFNVLSTARTFMSDLAPCADGGYLLIGKKFTNDTRNDGWVAKVNAEFNFLWEKTYGGSDADLFKRIVSNPDGTFLIVGTTNSTDGSVASGLRGEMDVWLVKIAADGKLLWEKTFGTPYNDQPIGLQRSKNGEYVIGAKLVSPFKADLIDYMHPAPAKKEPTILKSDAKMPLAEGENNCWIFKVKE